MGFAFLNPRDPNWPTEHAVSHAVFLLIVLVVMWAANRHYDVRVDPTLEAQLDWLKEKQRKEKEANDNRRINI
jgi:hypothetical protein